MKSAHDPTLRVSRQHTTLFTILSDNLTSNRILSLLFLKYFYAQKNLQKWGKS